MPKRRIKQATGEINIARARNVSPEILEIAGKRKAR
jgi:hypothetical protein